MGQCVSRRARRARGRRWREDEDAASDKVSCLAVAKEKRSSTASAETPHPPPTAPCSLVASRFPHLQVAFLSPKRGSEGVSWLQFVSHVAWML
ncbi:hypothetical protein BHM03_00059580 [Ensete ventricosum]|nr:hypothetical protein BHM03_00059580 [Ensete ventricosum]